MGAYDGVKYIELQALCKQRGLPADGKTEDLVTRLETYDVARPALSSQDDDLLDALGADDLPASDQQAAQVGDRDDPPTPPPPADPGFSIAASPPQEVGVVSLSVFKIAFPCPHELSSGLHEEFRQRALAQATVEGHQPRGYAGVRRSGWANVNGMRHALYEVPLRRRR